MKESDPKVIIVLSPETQKESSQVLVSGKQNKNVTDGKKEKEEVIENSNVAQLVGLQVLEFAVFHLKN